MASKATGSDEGVTLPADGSAVAVETTQKKIVRRATAAETGANGSGNGHGNPDDGPVNPLIGHSGGKKNSDPDRIVAVKLYKGTSSKSGVHVTTIDGDEIANVDEDYIRGNFAPEWGFGPYYLQGINRKGQPVAEGGQMVNIGSPKGAAATPNGNGHGSSDQLMSFMQAQLAQQQTLLLALISNTNKGGDGGSTAIVAEMVKANAELMKALTTREGKPTDPMVMQAITDANARARDAEQRSHELHLESLRQKNTDEDKFGLAAKAMNAVGTIMEQATNLLPGNTTNPKVEMVREVVKGAKEVFSDAVPILRDVLRKDASPAPPAPALPPANRVFRVSSPPPKPAADAPRGDPANGAPRPANPPAAEMTHNGTETEPTPEAQAMTELQAVQEIDAAIRDDGHTPEDVAGLFVKHATVTKAFPAFVVGALARMDDEALSKWPKRLTAMYEYDVMHWATEPFWTKLRSAMVPLRAYVQQETEREAREAAEAAAQGAAPR